MANYLLAKGKRLTIQNCDHNKFWKVTGIDGKAFPPGSFEFFVLRQSVMGTTEPPRTSYLSLSNLKSTAATLKGQPDSFYKPRTTLDEEHLDKTLTAWNESRLVLTRGVPGFNYTWEDLSSGVLSMRGTMMAPDFTGEAHESAASETSWLPSTARLSADKDDPLSQFIAMGTGGNSAVYSYLSAGTNMYLPLGIVAHIRVGRILHAVAWFSAAEIQVQGPLNANQWSLYEGLFVGGSSGNPIFYTATIPEEVGLATWPKRPFALTPYIPASTTPPGSPTTPGSPGQVQMSESEAWLIHAKVYIRQLQDDGVLFTPIQ